MITRKRNIVWNYPKPTFFERHPVFTRVMIALDIVLILVMYLTEG